VGERNPGDGQQAEPAENDRDEPRQKDEKDEPTRAPQPPGTPSGGILQDGRFITASRRSG